MSKYKILLGFLFSTALSGCQNQLQQPLLTNDITDSISCEYSVKYNNIYLCLPSIVGFKECYNLPTINKRANEYNYDGNTILAYYIREKASKEAISNADIHLDEYFQIFAVDQYFNQTFDDKKLKMMADGFEKQFDLTKWKSLKNKLENVYDISLGNPILIERYSISPNAYSFEIIMKTITRNEEHIQVMVMNLITVHSKLYNLGYYLDYVDSENMKGLKAKNDFAVLSFLNINKKL